MPRSAFVALLLAATPALAGLDVVFLIDTTGSIGGELGEVKERVRIGVVAFRDKSDAYVTKRSLLDPDVEVSFRFLAALTAYGGGDGPGTAINDMNWDPPHRA